VTASRGKKVLIVVPPFWNTVSPSLGASRLAPFLVRLLREPEPRGEPATQYSD